MTVICTNESSTYCTFEIIENTLYIRVRSVIIDNYARVLWATKINVFLFMWKKQKKNGHRAHTTIHETRKITLFFLHRVTAPRVLAYNHRHTSTSTVEPTKKKNRSLLARNSQVTTSCRP